MERSSLVIGLTGQTGAGKSTVSRMLREAGYPVIDADVVARQVVQKGTACLTELALAFGVDILDAEGNLNRKRLGRIVFADPAQRMKLNRITFPHIQREIALQIEAWKQNGAPFVFLDAPTLFESGSDKFCDTIVSVMAQDDLRLQRILRRDDLTEQEARDRMASQNPDDFYITRSDHVLYNNDEPVYLKIQVQELLDKLHQTS